MTVLINVAWVLLQWVDASVLSYTQTHTHTHTLSHTTPSPLKKTLHGLYFNTIFTGSPSTQSRIHPSALKCSLKKGSPRTISYQYGTTQEQDESLVQQAVLAVTSLYWEKFFPLSQHNICHFLGNCSVKQWTRWALMARDSSLLRQNESALKAGRRNWLVSQHWRLWRCVLIEMWCV